MNIFILTLFPTLVSDMPALGMGQRPTQGGRDQHLLSENNKQHHKGRHIIDEPTSVKQMQVVEPLFAIPSSKNEEISGNE